MVYCEFDCSVINLECQTDYGLGFIESHSTHSQTIKPSLLVSSALVFVESVRQSLCSYGSSKSTGTGTIKCQKNEKKKQTETTFSKEGLTVLKSTVATYRLHLDLITLVLVNLPVLHLKRLFD